MQGVGAPKQAASHSPFREKQQCQAGDWGVYRMPPIDLEGGTNRCVSVKDDDEDSDKAEEMG